MSVSAIVLAAGRSSRFAARGEHKLLATLNGIALVRLSVAAAVDAAIGAVIVVTGAEAARVEQALAGLSVHIVHEPAYGDGMATSLIRGIRSLAPDTDAAVIGLADQPRVRPEAYRRVVQVWQSTHASIVVPRYATHHGPAHPVLFAAATFDEVLALRGDVGARQVIARDPVRVAVATLDWDAPVDIDTRDDLARLTG